MTIAA